MDTDRQQTPKAREDEMEVLIDRGRVELAHEQHVVRGLSIDVWDITNLKSESQRCPIKVMNDY